MGLAWKYLLFDMASQSGMLKDAGKAELTLRSLL